eukprot:20045-Eustigmatos_ZCMA.PRE.1
MVVQVDWSFCMTDPSGGRRVLERRTHMITRAYLQRVIMYLPSLKSMLEMLLLQCKSTTGSLGSIGPPPPSGYDQPHPM